MPLSDTTRTARVRVTTRRAYSDPNDGRFYPAVVEELTLRFTVEVDEDLLAQMVARAAVSRTGRSRLGPVTVRVHPEDRVTRTRQPDTLPIPR